MAVTEDEELAFAGAARRIRTRPARRCPAARGTEDALYSLASQIESAQPWAEHRPRLP